MHIVVKKKIYYHRSWQRLVVAGFLIPSLFFFTIPFTTQAAGPPAVISYQGRLSNASGSLLGGSAGTAYYFKFSLWSAASGGSKLWPTGAPSAVSTTVREGLFNVNIGDTANGYPDTLDYAFGDTNVFLEVSVSSNGVSFETLEPRQQLSSAAFAQVASRVVGTGNSTLGNATSTNFFSTTASSTNLFSASADIGSLIARALSIGGQTYSSLNGTGLTNSGGSLALNQAASLTWTGAHIFDSITRSTTTQATSTNLYSSISTFGSLFGAGLQTCDPSTGKLVWSNGAFTCGTDSGGSGNGITAFGGQYSTAQTGATQVLATSTDDNIVLTITSGANTHTFAPSWTGTLAAGRGGTGIGSPAAAGILLGSYAGGGWQQVATSSLGLLTTNVSEGSNLYWTQPRFDAALAGTTTLNNLAVLRGVTDIVSTRSTSTAATSTSFFATTASSTNLFSASATLGTLSVSGTITGSVSGSANTANTLLTPRNINGTAFDGSQSITITAASSTLLANSNAFTGANIFENITRSTTTNATSTNFFTTTASSTNLFSASANFGLVSVSGIITGSVSGNAGTATLLQNARNINGTAFNGSQDITITAASSTLLANSNTFSGVNIFDSITRSSTTAATTTNFFSTIASSTNLFAVGANLGSLTVANVITGSVSGNAGTATILQTSRNINGTAFDGSQSIIITAASSTLLANSNLFTGANIFDLITRSTTTNATSTSFFSMTSSSTNLYTTNLFGNTANLTESGNLFYTDARVNAYLHASSTLPKTYTSNTFTGAQVFDSITRSTTTAATSTNFFSTTASSSNLYSASASLGALSVTGTITGSVTGNAGTATILQNARNINGTSFNGSQDITVTAASSTLLSNSNTFSGANTFDNITRSTTTAATSTNFSVSTAINLMGETITNFTSYVRGLFSAGTGLSYLSGQFSIDQAASLTWTGAHVFNSITRSTTTAATTTNIFATTASSSNLFAAAATIGSLTVTSCTGCGGAAASSTLHADSNTFTGANIFNSITRSTTTAATSTSSFATTASSTNLFSANASIGSLTVTSCVGCGGATAASSTLLADSNTFSGANIFENITRSTTTAATSTNFFSTTASSSNLYSASAALGALSVTNTITGSVSGSANTANTLATPRNINGTAFDGSQSITITAASSTLLANSNTFSGVNIFDSITRSTTTAATTTNLFSTTASSTNLYTTNLFGNTANLTESGNLFYTDARVNTYLHASTTLPKTYTSNTFSAAQIFDLITRSTTTAATTTNLFSTTASSTNLFAAAANLGSLTVANIITGSITGNAGTATILQTSRNINGTAFDGSQSITITAASSTLLANSNLFTGANIFDLITRSTSTAATSTNFFSTIASSTSLFSASASLGALSVTGTITGSVTGNAGTATLLQNSRNINGTAFNGSQDITITAASSTLLANSNTFTGASIFDSITRSTTTAATSTNSFATTASSTNLAATNFSFGTGSIGSLTGLTSLANLLATGSSTLQNFTFINATGTNATTTTFFSTSASSTNLFATNFNFGLGIFARATGTAATTTNSFASIASSTSLFSTNADFGLLTFGRATGTAATTTNSFASVASSTNLFATTFSLGSGTIGSLTGLTSLANLLATGSSTLQNFTFINATGTSATTTNFFATTASSTSLFSASASLGALSVTGTITGSVTGNAGTATLLQNSRNINGTAFNGSQDITITAASSTLLANSNTFTGANIFDSITRSTTTAATSTNSFATTASSTNLAATAFNFGNGIFANGTSTNATSTTSFATTASSTNLFATSFNFGSGSIGSITGLTSLANILATGSSTFQNLTFLRSTSTDATSTNLFATTASSTNLFATNLFANTANLMESGNLFYTDARVNSYIHASTTLPKLYSSNLFTGAQIFDLITRSTSTAATSTSFFATTASSTNLFSAAATIGSLTVTSCTGCGGGAASSTLHADSNTFTGANIFNNITRSTTTAATTTNLFSTTASSTNLYSAAATIGALTVTSCTGCGGGSSSSTLLADSNTFSGVNTFTAANTFENITRSTTTAATSTNFSVSTAINLMGETITNFTSYVRGLFSAGTGLSYLSGQFSIDQAASLTWTGAHVFNSITRSTTTAATTTNLFSSIASSTSLFSTNADFGLLTFGRATGTAATTTNSFASVASSTNLFATTFSLGSGSIGSLTGLTSLANLLATGSSTLQNFTFVNATGTNATTTNFFATTASSTNLFSTAFNFGTGSIGSLTGLTSLANILATGSSTLQNFTFINATGTNATTTNFFATTASSTSLFSGLGTFANILTNASSTFQNLTFLRSTSTDATSTNLFATTASSTNLFASNATFSSLLLNNNSSTTLQRFTFTTATGTAATTTNSFASIASSTSLFSAAATIGSLTVTTCTGCGGGSSSSTLLADSNLFSGANIFNSITRSTTTAATTTNLFSTTASSTNLFSAAATIGVLTVTSCNGCGGGAASSTLHADSNTFTGANIFNNITRSTTTAATTTNLFSTTASSTSLYSTSFVFGNGTLANSTGTNATTTNFFATTASSTNLFANAASISTLTATTSNLGLTLTASDTNPGCAAGDYRIYADTSETKLKKCENGTASDLDGNMDDVDIFVSGTAQTWTKPANVAKVYVEVWAGGGAGVTAGANTSGGGGGGGGYGSALTGVDGNEVYTVGSGGATSAATGGNSTFTTNGTAVTANSSTAASTVTGGPGGAAGTGGDLNLAGGAGGNSLALDAASGGTGGGSPLGGAGGSGGAGSNASGTGSNGKAGTAPGGGGGGGSESGGTFGAGAAGMIIVWEITGSVSGADLAEWYPTEPDVELGDVVAIGERNLEYVSGSLGDSKISILRKAKAGDKLVGVVSSVPSKIMGFDITEYAEHSSPIALSGRVPVKVSTANGPIKEGDELTVSAVPGVAIKSTKAGEIIGKALNDYDGPQGTIGEVLALVNTGYSIGARTRAVLENKGISSDEVESRYAGIDFGRLLLADMLGEKDKILAQEVSISEVYTDRLGAGLEVVTPRVVTNTLVTDFIEPALGKDIFVRLGEEGRFIISQGVATTLETLGATTTVASYFDSFGNAHLAGVVTAADFVVGTTSLSAKLSSLFDIFEELKLSFASTTSAFGNSLLALTARVDRLESATTTLATTATTTAYFTGDMAGRALIRQGARSVDIVFDQEYLEAPIVNATIALEDASSSEEVENAIFEQDLRYLVTRKGTKGFTILLNKKATVDLPFSWVALPVQGGKLFISTEVETSAVPDSPPPAIESPPETSTSTPEGEIENPDALPEPDSPPPEEVVSSPGETPPPPLEESVE